MIECRSNHFSVERFVLGRRSPSTPRNRLELSSLEHRLRRDGDVAYRPLQIIEPPDPFRLLRPKELTTDLVTAGAAGVSFLLGESNSCRFSIPPYLLAKNELPSRLQCMFCSILLPDPVQVEGLSVRRSTAIRDISARSRTSSWYSPVDQAWSWSE